MIHDHKFTLYTDTYKSKEILSCVITAILDQPNCFMACIIPVIISASLDKDLRKCGNILVLERRGDVDVGAIWKN